MSESYQVLLDEAKSLTSRIQVLDKIITAIKIIAIEAIDVNLTDSQLELFINKRAELKTRKDEICDTVKQL